MTMGERHMLRSRWILAVLVALALGGAWLGLEQVRRSERTVVEEQPFELDGKKETSEPVGALRLQREPIDGEKAEPERIAVENGLDGSTRPVAAQDAHFSVQVVALETNTPLRNIQVALRFS